MDTAVTDHLLSTTRAVRKRLDLDRPVEPEVILDCIRLAVQAPTGSNAQGWRWMVVTDAAKRAELARIYTEAAAATSLRLAGGGTPDQTQRVYESALYLTEILDRVPVHVIPCIEGRADKVPPRQAAGFYGSILPAAWSFMLALRSRGLGSAWTTLHLVQGKGGRAAGHPRGLHPGGVVPGGLHHGDDFKPAAAAAGRVHRLLGHLVVAALAGGCVRCRRTCRPPGGSAPSTAGRGGRA